MGTAAPESIYEARFVGKIQAARPSEQTGDCEIVLPLPPQIISLADLSITAAGQPSEKVVVRDGQARVARPTARRADLAGRHLHRRRQGPVRTVGPAGGILDQFKMSLVAKGSDVRLLELSLQPTSLERSGGSSTYSLGLRAAACSGSRSGSTCWASPPSTGWAS